MNPDYLNNPEELESLYRKDKSQFQMVFSHLQTQNPDLGFVKYWKTRIEFDVASTFQITKKDIVQILITITVFGTIATSPFWNNLTEKETSLFFLRNISLLAFPSLIFFFLRERSLSFRQIGFLGIIILLLSVFINLLPGDPKNEPDTLILAGIHLPVVLWGLLAFAFSNKNHHEFLRFNGDLLVSAGILFLAWMIMSGITMGLFNLIGINIEDFYPKYVMVYGFTGIPILAAVTVIRTNGFVNQVSPWIARIFSPLALVMLSVFLIFFLKSGRDPFTDREFLLIFNLILAAVLALILFALSSSQNHWLNLVLLGLSVVTILVNLLALSAIIYRLADLGITPNRLAVLGANVLFLIHLVLTLKKLVGMVRGKINRDQVLSTIGNYLPVYIIWAGVVVVIFPLIFGFK